MSSFQNRIKAICREMYKSNKPIEDRHIRKLPTLRNRVPKVRDLDFCYNMIDLDSFQQWDEDCSMFEDDTIPRICKSVFELDFYIPCHTIEKKTYKGV